jgi:hypothetical protein
MALFPLTPRSFSVLVLAFMLLLYFTSMAIDIVGENLWAWAIGGSIVWFAMWGLGFRLHE